MIFTKKSFVQKIIFAILFIILLNFIIPSISVRAADDDSFLASVGGVLFDIAKSIGDGIMWLIQKILLGTPHVLIEVDTSVTVWQWIIGIAAALLTIAVIVAIQFIPVVGQVLTAGLLATVIAGATVGIIAAYAVGRAFPEQIDLPLFYVTPLQIFTNELGIINIDFFNPMQLQTVTIDGKSCYYIEKNGVPGYNETQYDVSTGTVSRKGDVLTTKSIATQLRGTISAWYYTIRNIALIGLLTVLVYVGIRIILSSTASEKAKYKKMITDWLVAVCLIFVLHYIMSFSVTIVGKIIDALHSESVDTYVIINEKNADGSTNENGKKILDFLEKYRNDILQEYSIDMNNYIQNVNGSRYLFWPTNFAGEARIESQLEGNTDKETFLQQAAYTMIYLVLIFFTLFFLVFYIKRVIYMAFLTLIAPLIALTYPIDKMNDGQAQAFNVWLKEYMYNLLVQPFHLILYMILINSAMDFAKENLIYTCVALGFMLPAEKLLRKMFNLNKAETASAFSGAAAGAAVSNLINKAGAKAKGIGGGSGKKIGSGSNGDKDDGESGKGIRTKDNYNEYSELGKHRDGEDGTEEPGGGPLPEGEDGPRPDDGSNPPPEGEDGPRPDDGSNPPPEGEDGPRPDDGSNPPPEGEDGPRPDDGSNPPPVREDGPEDGKDLLGDGEEPVLIGDIPETEERSQEEKTEPLDDYQEKVPVDQLNQIYDDDDEDWYGDLSEDEKKDRDRGIKDRQYYLDEYQKAKKENRNEDALRNLNKATEKNEALDKYRNAKGTEKRTDKTARAYARENSTQRRQSPTSSYKRGNSNSQRLHSPKNQQSLGKLVRSCLKDPKRMEGLVKSALANKSINKGLNEVLGNSQGETGETNPKKFVSSDKALTSLVKQSIKDPQKMFGLVTAALNNDSIQEGISEILGEMPVNEGSSVTADEGVLEDGEEKPTTVTEDKEGDNSRNTTSTENKDNANEGNNRTRFQEGYNDGYNDKLAELEGRKKKNTEEPEEIEEEEVETLPDGTQPNNTPRIDNKESGNDYDAGYRKGEEAAQREHEAGNTSEQNSRRTQNTTRTPQRDRIANNNQQVSQINMGTNGRKRSIKNGLKAVGRTMVNQVADKVTPENIATAGATVLKKGIRGASGLVLGATGGIIGAAVGIATGSPQNVLTYGGAAAAAGYSVSKAAINSVERINEADPTRIDNVRDAFRAGAYTKADRKALEEKEEKKRNDKKITRKTKDPEFRQNMEHESQENGITDAEGIKEYTRKAAEISVTTGVTDNDILARATNLTNDASNGGQGLTLAEAMSIAKLADKNKDTISSKDSRSALERRIKKNIKDKEYKRLIEEGKQPSEAEDESKAYSENETKKAMKNIHNVLGYAPPEA